MKRKFDGKKGSKQEYRARELVWVDKSNLSDGYPSKKLLFKRARLFLVMRKVGESLYELQIPKTWKNLHPVINESWLKPYVRPVFDQQQEQSNTNLKPIGGSEWLQEIEEILDSQWKENQLQYLIKWRGQLLEEMTWEHCSDVCEEANKACYDFHHRHPGTPHMPTIRIPGNIYTNIARMQF